MWKNIFIIFVDLLTHYWLYGIIVFVSWAIIYRLNNSERFVKLFMFDNIEKLYSQNMRVVIATLTEKEKGISKWITKKLSRFLVFHSRKVVIIVELFYIISLLININYYRIDENTSIDTIVLKSLNATVHLYLVLFVLFLIGVSCKLLKQMFKIHKDIIDQEIAIENLKLQKEMLRIKRTKRKRSKKMDKNVRGMEHDVDIRESMENVPNYDENNYGTESEEDKESK